MDGKREIARFREYMKKKVEDACTINENPSVKKEVITFRGLLEKCKDPPYKLDFYKCMKNEIEKQFN